MRKLTQKQMQWLFIANYRLKINRSYEPFIVRMAYAIDELITTIKIWYFVGRFIK